MEGNQSFYLERRADAAVSDATSSLNLLSIAGGLDKASSSKSNMAGAGDNHLPAVEFQQQAVDQGQPLRVDGGATAWSGGYMEVAREVARGAYNEITNHPGRVVQNVALGFATGAAITLLGQTAVIIGGAATLAYGGYKVWNHGKELWHSAEVTANPSSRHSEKELIEAHARLQNLGAGAVEVGAGIIGGTAGMSVARAGIASIASKGASSGRSAEAVPFTEKTAVVYGQEVKVQVYKPQEVPKGDWVRDPALQPDFHPDFKIGAGNYRRFASRPEY